MVTESLTVLVVAYDEVDTAFGDFADLKAWGDRTGRQDDFEAAVLKRFDDGSYDVRATTVRPDAKGTWLGAGLGFAAGLLISPALPVAIVGAGVGVLIGTVIDEVDDFKRVHKTAEVTRLVDGSAADLIVIADDTTANEIAEAAVARDRRVVVPLRTKDIDALRRELADARIPFTL